MCISDWRIGRLISSEIKQYTPGIGATATIAPNRNRVGISFCSLYNGATITQWPIISFAGIQFDVLAQNDRYRHYTIMTHGDAPMKQWQILTNVAANSVGVIEYFLPESYLAAGLEEFMRQYQK